AAFRDPALDLFRSDGTIRPTVGSDDIIHALPFVLIKTCKNLFLCHYIPSGVFVIRGGTFFCRSCSNFFAWFNRLMLVTSYQSQPAPNSSTPHFHIQSL